MKYRNHKAQDDYLFCNVFGQQLAKIMCYHMLYGYNKHRDVETTDIHKYRHMFAKQRILSCGNVLGYSSLEISQNYIHLLVSDVAKLLE